MELNQNPWEKWGFSYNPFNTRALSMSSQHLPIDKAFVGRSMESQESRQLINIIRNPGGGCGIVEGPIGVGKTTFVNYHKYLWEYKAQDRLITPLREISVYGNWEAKALLMEILGHLSNKILYVLGQKKADKNKILKKIRFLHDIFYDESMDIEGSMFGFGFGYVKHSQVNVPTMTESQLIAYLMDMVKEIKSLGYAGVFLHFDNLELLARQDLEKCRHLFEEIRDILQLPDIYHIFVCKNGFYSEIIAPSERVRSIVNWPIQLPPLSSDEVIKAINTRYELLALNPDKKITPVSDQFIEKLYKLYRGKIRFIMDSIAKIAVNFCETELRTLKDKEAEEILLNICMAKISRLSPREFEVLKTTLKFQEFTNEDIAKNMKMQQSNVSKMLKDFQEFNLIYLSRKQGRHVYYCPIEDLRILLKSPTMQMNRNISLPIFKQASPSRKRYRKLYTYLQKHNEISRAVYEQLNHVSLATAGRDLANLVKEGKLQKIGVGRLTHYIPVKRNR